MKLLMLMPRFPYPPTRGDCIRAWGWLEQLAAWHNVWLACAERVHPPAAHLAHVKQRCCDVAVIVRPHWVSLLRGGASLLRGHSLSEAYFRDPRLTQVLREWSSAVKFDAVLTFSAAMSQYAAGVTAPRQVLDLNEVASFKWSQHARRARLFSSLYALEACRLAARETKLARVHDVCLVVNQRERRKLSALTDELRTAVVHTGIDPARHDEPDAGTRLACPREPVVGMIGSMSYPPNVRGVNWFGRWVWPRVKHEVPTARWLIVGSRPARDVRRWAHDASVTVTGYVPDVRPYLRQMRVFANSVRDEIGVQTKLIEALAAGKAAVVTRQVADGLDYDGEPAFLTVGAADTFAEAVVRLLRNDELAERLGQRARQVARARFDVHTQALQVERWLSPAALAPAPTPIPNPPSAPSRFVPQPISS